MIEEYKNMLIHELEEQDKKNITVHSLEIHDNVIIADVSFTWNLNGWDKEVNHITKHGYIENDKLMLF
jgi:hypothetical protein